MVHMVFKNNSATSSRNYGNKTQPVGKTGEESHIIDETITIKTYARIVGELRPKFGEPPAA